MEIGQLIKIIRKSKKIRQADLVGDELPRTTLSKIENCKINPSTRTFFFLIGRLGISFDEFSFLLNDRQLPKKEQLLSEFSNLRNNCNIEKIEALKKKIQQYLSTQSSLELEIILEILDVQVLLNHDSQIFQFCPLAKQRASKIWQRLAAYDTWYMNELKFVNSILFYFSIDMAASIARRLVIELEKYDSYPRSEEVIAYIYFNVSTIMLVSGDKQASLKYLLICEEKAREQKRADIYASALFRRAYLTDDQELLEKATTILETFGDDAVLSDLQQERITFQ